MSKIGILKKHGQMRLLPAVLAVAAVMFVSCRIEPPLHLAEDTPNTMVAIGEVVTDIDIIWNIGADWHHDWWYGWDLEDIERWGPLEYPDPTSFEARFYAYGEDSPEGEWTDFDRLTVFEKTFRRRYPFGYHDMLMWSNIDAENGVQSVVINESDPDNIHATTTRTRLGFAAPASGNAYHNPEIFYAGGLNKFFISRDTADYDYFDPSRNAWVKRLHIDLNPMVYIYLVQVVVYNNKGRITGMTDNAAINSLAQSVHLHTGRTSNTPVTVAYGMHLKKDLPARDGRHADIFGGKMTTFGLCDMEPWVRSRATAKYQGSRGDLRNYLMVPLQFANATDSAYAYDITPQIQRQAHGGIITIEIDADTLVRPTIKHQGAGGFDPELAPPDSIQHEFQM